MDDDLTFDVVLVLTGIVSISTLIFVCWMVYLLVQWVTAQ